MVADVLWRSALDADSFYEGIPVDHLIQSTNLQKEEINRILTKFLRSRLIRAIANESGTLYLPRT